MLKITYYNRHIEIKMDKSKNKTYSGKVCVTIWDNLNIVKHIKTSLTCPQGTCRNSFLDMIGTSKTKNFMT